MSYFKLFWRLLMTPSDHKDENPTVEVGNQSGHVLWAGTFAPVCVCAVWFMLFGEMPYRVAVGFGVVIVYGVFIEYLSQGWRGRDSFSDTMFVGVGNFITLAPFKEMGISANGRPVLEFNERLWVVSVVMLVIIFAIHMYKRVKVFFNKNGKQ